MPTAAETATPAEQFDDLAQQQRADIMGMWVFLATELLLFGAVFGAFTILRTEHAGVFAQAAEHLDLALGTLNTALLLSSGMTMAFAEQAVGAGRRRLTLWLLSATIALGAVFLAIKGYEWYQEYAEGLVPAFGLPFDYPGDSPEIARLFFDMYFVLTGLHAAHMLIGLGVLAVMLVLAAVRGPSAKLTRQVRITGLYWAFVDVVWIFVFTSLYLLRV